MGRYERHKASVAQVVIQYPAVEIALPCTSALIRPHWSEAEVRNNVKPLVDKVLEWARDHCEESFLLL